MFNFIFRLEFWWRTALLTCLKWIRSLFWKMARFPKSDPTKNCWHGKELFQNSFFNIWMMLAKKLRMVSSTIYMEEIKNWTATLESLQTWLRSNSNWKIPWEKKNFSVKYPVAGQNCQRATAILVMVIRAPLLLRSEVYPGNSIFNLTFCWKLQCHNYCLQE